MGEYREPAIRMLMLKYGLTHEEGELVVSKGHQASKVALEAFMSILDTVEDERVNLITTNLAAKFMVKKLAEAIMMSENV